MNGAQLKTILSNGGRVYGTMITLGRNPQWVPVLNNVGLDYVIIDTEHTPRGRSELGDYLAMMNTSTVVPIVRVPIPSSHYVTMAIDAGSQGVLAPYCETIDEVKEVIAAVKLRPLKGASARQVIDNENHISPETKSYLERRNQNNVAIIGIESKTAVDNLPNILEVRGIDAIFVGPNDMSISLGVPDGYDSDVYKRTVKLIIDICEQKGVPVLVHHQTPDLSAYWMEQGARVVLHGTDRRALAEGFRNDFSKLRQVEQQLNTNKSSDSAPSTLKSQADPEELTI
ncbi:hypothetical protein FIM12_08285 [SAR202 cluster bacterium AD-804-J14_MRT_500m]|nr:hypothetical protein [SAR202 cluster bacterium AD-804-J14_MRT_500m]